MEEWSDVWKGRWSRRATKGASGWRLRVQAVVVLNPGESTAEVCREVVQSKLPLQTGKSRGADAASPGAPTSRM